MIVDDDVLDDAASALCDKFLEMFTQLPQTIWEPFRFSLVTDEAKEIYRELALVVINSVHEAVHG